MHRLHWLAILLDYAVIDLGLRADGIERREQERRQIAPPYNG
jgi:hypothetical protein